MPIRHALLLNSSYEPISFLNERRLFKLLINSKIEPLEFWDETVPWFTDRINIPAVVRLKNFVKMPILKQQFNRRGIFIRDQFVCQYCREVLTYSQSTVDHVIPKSRGGKTTWTNCVTSCKSCNLYKANLTPQEARLTLIAVPFTPLTRFKISMPHTEYQHPSWIDYLT